MVTQKELSKKMYSNIIEIKSRGAYIISITTNDNRQIEEISDDTIFIPNCNDMISANLSVIPLQLLAYYVSDLKGLDVDKPRNLAKSVTVE